MLIVYWYLIVVLLIPSENNEDKTEKEEEEEEKRYSATLCYSQPAHPNNTSLLHYGHLFRHEQKVMHGIILILS